MFINTFQISCPKYIQGETNLFLNLHMSKRAQLYTKPQKAFKHFDNIEDQIVFSWQRSYETISFTITIKWKSNNQTVYYCISLMTAYSLITRLLKLMILIHVFLYCVTEELICKFFETLIFVDLYSIKSIISIEKKSAIYIG